MTGKYGKAAVKATRLQHEGKYNSPKTAWNAAVKEGFPNSKSSQEKGCPKNAYLGLCEDGLVRGIPLGDYTGSELNKMYAVKAVCEIRKDPELQNKPGELWQRVIGKETRKNSQMDVVIALWKNNFIV